jgi:hypothetical protein
MCYGIPDLRPARWHVALFAGLVFAWLSPAAQADDELAARVRDVYRYLAAEMDRWSGGTVVYDERASGGAGFHPINWSGDADDLTLDEGCMEKPVVGTCLKLTYRPRKTNGWVSLTWAYPDRPGPNWGEAPGRNLAGARTLRGLIRGREGKEVVELSIGGINRMPDSKHPQRKYRDSFGPVPLPRTLSTRWEPFEIAIPEGVSLESVIGGFTCTLRASENRDRADHAGSVTVYLDEVHYDNAEPGGLRLIRSYLPTVDPRDDPIRNSAYAYDNAVALLAFLARRGDGDAQRRARILADTFVALQTHDRSYRTYPLAWRNAYMNGPQLDPATNAARLPGIYDPREKRMAEDRYGVSLDTGNVAWVGTALLSAHALLESDDLNRPYLNAALSAGLWIEENCRVEDDLGGYSGGFEGWEKKKKDEMGPKKLPWRSVEHCLDVYVFFSKLAKATGDPVWRERARHARRFVLNMWNPEGGHFWVGVRDRLGTLNKDAIAADAQTWSLLAMGEDGEYRRRIGWVGPPALPAVLEWVERHCRVEGRDGCGYRFSDRGTGIMPEMAAHLAAGYHYLGEAQRAEEILREIVRLRSPERPGRGGIRAAHPGFAETGFRKEFALNDVQMWTYPPAHHVGASAWFCLAAQGANAYHVEKPPPKAR